MSGYTRQSAADITPGEVVNAAPLNAEFNTMQAAMSNASGHTHNGATGEGAYIPIISDADNDTKVHVETSADEDIIRVTVAGTELLQVAANVFRKSSGTTVDIGASANRFDNVYTSNLDATAATLTNLTVPTGGSATFGGAKLTDIGSPSADTDAATKGYVNDRIVDTISIKTTTVSTGTIATGSMTFTLADDLGLGTGASVKVVYDLTNWVFGSVSSYTQATKVMIVDVTRTLGSGTYAAWTVNVSGIAGPENAVATFGGTADLAIDMNGNLLTIDQVKVNATDQYKVGALGTVATAQTITLVNEPVLTITMDADVAVVHTAPDSGYEFTKKYRVTQGSGGGFLFRAQASTGSTGTWPNDDEPDWASLSGGVETRLVAVIESASVVRLFPGG
jgi:hypothetical protein